MPQNTYQTSVVAYLDICGLKEAVQKSSRKRRLAKEIESMLSGLQGRCVELNKQHQWGPQIPDLRARAFSDSIILTCPIASDDPTASDNALRKIAVITSAYQMQVIAQHGFFIRGAITVGPHCDRNDVCFGPALIEAYEAERQLANWPRAILLPKALKLIAHGHHPYLLRDDGGITYLDYLLLCTANLVIQSDTPKKRRAGLHSFSWVSLMEAHKARLEVAVRDLSKDAPLRILYRYHSLAQYHNRYLRQVLRGGRSFPLTELLEFVLSRKKGMTKDQMNSEISKFTSFFSYMDKRQENCLIDMRHIFAPLRHRGSKNT